MSNHYHVVLHVDKEQAEGWDDREVIERWHELFSGIPLTKRFLAGDSLLKQELKLVAKLAGQWRERLMDISWYMLCLKGFFLLSATRVRKCRRACPFA